MKDYYRILGLKETATAEEIHRRWIELMQKYHPDHSLDGKYDEEKAKEINEAYQVLKHSASRVEYDFGRQHQRGQKTFSAWKLILPASVLTIILIFTAFLFRRPESPVSLNQQPKFPSPKISVPYEEPTREVVSSKDSPKAERSVKIEKESEEKVASQQIGQAKKAAPSTATKTVEPSFPTIRSESSSKSPARSTSTKLSRPRPVDKQKPTSISELSKKIPAVHSVSDSNASTKKDDRSLIAKLPPPIATAEEVKKVFNQYIERYNRKDIHGFLSLFSPQCRGTENVKHPADVGLYRFQRRSCICRGRNGKHYSDK